MAQHNCSCIMTYYLFIKTEILKLSLFTKENCFSSQILYEVYMKQLGCLYHVSSVILHYLETSTAPKAKKNLHEWDSQLLEMRNEIPEWNNMAASLSLVPTGTIFPYPDQSYQYTLLRLNNLQIASPVIFVNNLLAASHHIFSICHKYCNDETACLPLSCNLLPPPRL